VTRLGKILVEQNWLGDFLGHFCGHWAIVSQKHLVTLTFDERLTLIESRVTRLSPRVTVHFGLFFENFRSSPHYWISFFPQLMLWINFDQNVLGYVLGDIINKLIWSPWLKEFRL
jgi:hypothetical protein